MEVVIVGLVFCLFALSVLIFAQTNVGKRLLND